MNELFTYFLTDAILSSSDGQEVIVNGLRDTSGSQVKDEHVSQKII